MIEGLKSTLVKVDAEGNIVLPGTGDRTVKNMRDPVLPQEPATKAYVDGSIDSTKIESADAQTRFETEEETGKATVTANGQRVFTMGEDRADWESAPDPVTGNKVTEATGAGAYAPGATGKYVRVRNALNELIGHFALLRGGPGEGLAFLRLMHEASVDSGAGLEASLMPDDGASSGLKARSVLGRGAYINLLADDSSPDGVATAELLGALLGSFSSVIADGLDVLFKARGATVPLNESGHEALPAGMTSLVQGLGLLDSYKISDIGVWSPTITPVSNVTAASLAKAGPYFVFEGAGVKWCYASCVASVTHTAASATSIYSLTLPVSSDLTSFLDVQGVLSGPGGGGGPYVEADTASDLALAKMYQPAGSTTGTAFRQFIHMVFEVK